MYGSLEEGKERRKEGCVGETVVQSLGCFDEGKFGSATRKEEDDRSTFGEAKGRKEINLLPATSKRTYKRCQSVHEIVDEKDDVCLWKRRNKGSGKCV